MARSRATLTAPIVLAIVLLGMFAIRSRGAEGPQLTNQAQNCAPVARADVVATAPGLPVDVDVLGNDTDADGDPLVFQILQASGGSAVVVDGGTPLDGSDDRVRFTPADPAPPQASFGYQAVDPDGAFGASLVTVFVNTAKLPPAGAQSEALDTNAGACGVPPATATTTIAPSSPPSFDEGPSATFSTRNGSGGGTSTGARTTSTTPTATTRRGETTTTRPPSPPNPQPPPPTNPPPSDPDCGPPPTSGSEAEEEAYKQCLRGG